jgi:copper oxidase (laccase) domain-containing protein
VDAPFRAHFTPKDEVHFAAAPPRNGTPRWHFDLPGYVATRLHALELGCVEDLARDTYAHPERYYSYRRATQSGAPNYGRQIALIAL